MRQSVAFRIIVSNLEKNIQRKTYSGEKWLSTDGLELLGALAWAGGAVSRACQAGWLAMLPRGEGTRGTGSAGNQRCIGVFWAENFLHF